MRRIICSSEMLWTLWTKVCIVSCHLTFCRLPVPCGCIHTVCICMHCISCVSRTSNASIHCKMCMHTSCSNENAYHTCILYAYKNQSLRVYTLYVQYGDYRVTTFNLPILLYANVQVCTISSSLQSQELWLCFCLLFNKVISARLYETGHFMQWDLRVEYLLRVFAF